MTVAGGLVPAADDLGDKLAMVHDAHPEQEERRPRIELVQQIQQVRGLALERRVRPVPVGQPKPPVDELVPVLEVDRQEEARLLHAADCKGSPGV